MRSLSKFLACATVALFPTLAHAQATVSVPASGNATVRPDGVRSGSGGLVFFNVQGSANNNFASFGVVDFVPPATEGADITGLSLALTQSNASFTNSGSYQVYLTDETGLSIIAGESTLTYQGGDGASAVDPALTNLQLLGGFAFVEVASGQTDTIDLIAGLGAAAEATVLAAVNAGETIRFVLVSSEPSVSATYAGQNNNAGPAPILTVELDGGAGGPAATVARINELHYDNASTDVGEFVELIGTTGQNLAGWQLVLYNGSSSVRAPYNTITFTDTDVFSADATSGDTGFFVVGLPTNGLQNGAPDGLALVDPEGTVVEFLSYEGSFEAASGPAAGTTSTDIGVAESSSTPIGQSLQFVNGTWVGPVAETRGAANAGPSFLVRTIMQIQGAAHTSPEVGNAVETSGVVTSVGTFDAVGQGTRTGFFLQDPVGDGNIATSDGVFVVSSAAVAVGDVITVQGIVEESGFFGSLSYTRINASDATVTASGASLPAPVVLGVGGRLPPNRVIEDDNFTSFDPDADGADFFESVEGMRVTVQGALAISGTSRFGEIFVVVDSGLGATGISARGTLNISPDDFNPEKIQIDPGRASSDPAIINLPFVDVGATLGDITGTVGYDFGNFQVQPDVAITAAPGGIASEATPLRSSGSSILVASYNVLNLETNDDDGDTDVANGRFDAIARQIVGSLNKPDIIALQEVQDNSGSVDDGTVAADVTLQALVDAIAAVDGPQYAFIDNTFITNNNSGGQPGGNIRTAFLYNPGRVELVPGSVRTVDDLAAFTGARLPLIASFEFFDETVTIVNNHLSSKGGSAPIFGTSQPFEARQEEVAVNGSLDERLAQSAEVRNFIDARLAADPSTNLVVLGDMNEFEFVSPVAVNFGEVLENLTLRVPADERYTFIFQGNSQSLDHILVSEALSSRTSFDIVHVNAEFAEVAARASDHEPIVAELSFVPTCDGKTATVYVDANGKVVGGPLSGRAYAGVLRGTAGPDVIVGTINGDQLVGLGGNDVICGGNGDDRIRGGEGDDALFGEGDDDVIVGGPGADTIDGGSGQDRCRDGAVTACER